MRVRAQVLDVVKGVDILNGDIKLYRIKMSLSYSEYWNTLSIYIYCDAYRVSWMARCPNMNVGRHTVLTQQNPS